MHGSCFYTVVKTEQIMLKTEKKYFGIGCLKYQGRKKTFSTRILDQLAFLGHIRRKEGPEELLLEVRIERNRQRTSFLDGLAVVTVCSCYASVRIPRMVVASVMSMY